MPTPRFLRLLSPTRFQLHIGDRVAAVLDGHGPVISIYILADEVRLLATVTDTAISVGARIADGEFDNDFRFEYTLNPEPSSNADLYFITQYATPSQKVIDSWTTEDPGAAIEAAREAQLYSLEERWAMDAEAGR